MMDKRDSLLSLGLIALACLPVPVAAWLGAPVKSRYSTEVVAGRNATHVARIVKDTIEVVTGSTYSFTVDTPEDQGLVDLHTTVTQLPAQLVAKDGSRQRYAVTAKDGAAKTTGNLVTGDKLVVTAEDGKTSKTYYIKTSPTAIAGLLELEQAAITINSKRSITLRFTAGQRTPDATVRIELPAGIKITPDNTTVNVIGRGTVKLKELATQSIGRVGSKYSYSKVGTYTITPTATGTVLAFQHLDLRPANGADLIIVIDDVQLSKAGRFPVKASYSTSKPVVLNSPGAGTEVATLTVSPTIADFSRVIDRSMQYRETADRYNSATFTWSSIKGITGVQLLQSTDKGKTWKNAVAKTDTKKGSVTVAGLLPNQFYQFRLSVKDGPYKGLSNIAGLYSGKLDVKSVGINGEDGQDYTDAINEAIASLHKLGGGTLLFSPGVYSVRTVHLQSNVYLYVAKGATIKALKGADAPESTWFSDKKYRSGLSPTDPGPYAEPENWLTKQDVGHHYFRNTMFFGTRLDNVKIIGNGYITGNGNLVTGDNVMKNTPDNRADKMFTLKLCTNLEIGGIPREEDLWYDSTKDEPYYIRKNGSKDYDVDNMLHIDRAGHFVLLATGTDNINVHNTYFAKQHQGSARDIYDFMACNNVTVTNIYSKVSSDDIVKPGSDCSLGFTRPARNYQVRNVIGDTNCNLFQIGSETADDIMDICVDNIYVLAANKAGFSISTNDGAHIKNIHLNCGHTGKVHVRSKMFRTFAPFFISISNRARILGAEVGRYAFTDDTVKHNELLIKNVNIGVVENIIINGIDIYEVYGGSSYGSRPRWATFDGKQRRATPIIAGYGLPDTKDVDGGLDFRLPNGKHTGYIKNVVFNDVHVLVKGGNPLSDTSAAPPELGVGQYNASNLKVQPSYGLWARHVEGLTVKDCSFNYEKRDSRYAIFLDDVVGASISGVKMVRASDNEWVIKQKKSSGVKIENVLYFTDQWDQQPSTLANIKPEPAVNTVRYPNSPDK